MAFSTVHRWRFALTRTPLGADYLWDGERGIGACGDWTIGGRVEGAWLSGHRLAGALLEEAS